MSDPGQLETTLPSGATLRLRPATRHDLPVLRQWDREPHVMAATGNNEGEDDPWDWEDTLAMGAASPDHPFWWNFIAELAAPLAPPRPIGYIQVIDPAREPTRYWGAIAGPDARAIDIWIGPPDCLGQGHGTAMMHLAIAFCFADPTVTHILIDPLATNTRAIRFYQSLGFQPQATHRFGEDTCQILRLPR